MSLAESTSARRPSVTWLDLDVVQKLQVWPREKELLDLVGRRQTAARPERPAIERGDRICVDQHVFEIAAERAQAASGEGAAKHVPGACGVHTIHLKGGRPNFATAAPRQAALR